MLAWRDMKNPKKGGAEVITDRYLNGLASKGHDITLFSAGVGSEKYNGYNIIRKGGVLGVYFYGWLYAFKNRKKYDVIIDQINTIPFFTFFGIPRDKRVCFFHQLCQNVWFWESKWPISWIGWLFENVYLFFYRNTKTIVVSKSTKDDLISKGFKDVHVIENGIDLKPVSKVGVKVSNQLCYVGRLKNSKRVHDCIEAVRLVSTQMPDVSLKIVGVGDKWYVEKLHKMAKGLNVEFCGRVSFDERNRIMGESCAILVTSIREGWGLIVTEANANGTVAITYDIHGLRDANRTGIVCRENNPKELSEEIIKFLKRKDLIKSMSIDALKDSYGFIDWNYRIDKFEEVLEK